MKTKEKCKKILPLLLVLVMLVQKLPIAVYADEFDMQYEETTPTTEEEEVAEVEEAIPTEEEEVAVTGEEMPTTGDEAEVIEAEAEPVSEGKEKSVDIKRANNLPSARTQGTDRTSDFTKVKATIKIQGMLAYAYDGVADSAVFTPHEINISYNPKIEFYLEYALKNSLQSDFLEGDYMLFEICEVIGGDSATNAIYWGGLSAERPLYNGGTLLGKGVLITEQVNDNTIKLSLKITFSDKIVGQSNISGNVTFGADIGGLGTGENATVYVDDQSVATINKVPSTPSEGPPGVMNSTEISSSKKVVVTNNESANTITWRIYATEFASKPFYDYENKINNTEYGDLIVEDILDINQTFQNITLRVPIYLYEEGNTKNTLKYLFTSKQYSWNTMNGIAPKLTNLSSQPNAKASVRATALSYAIITEPDETSPTFDHQRLIMNLGSPKKNGLCYKDLGLTMSTVIVELQKAYDNSVKVLTDNPLAGSTEELTDEKGKKGTKAGWEKFKKLYGDSITYYKGLGSDEDYIYSYELDIVTKVKVGQEETNLSSSASNSFSLEGGYSPSSGSATKNNFWSGAIRATAELGDVQIFKADSLYGNKAGDKPNAASVAGAMGDIEFEVYTSNGTGPLAFYEENGKYYYSSSGGDTTVITGKLGGDLIISGLNLGNYYVKEIWAPEGYYTDQNAKVYFYIDNSRIEYKLVNNDSRGVTLEKVDVDYPEKTLGDTTFELYKYTKSDFTDATKLSGFTSKLINSTVYHVYDNIGVDPLTTESDGQLTIVQLAAGKYYLHEVSAPKGYLVSDEKLTFELSDKKTGDAIINLGAIGNEFGDRVTFTGTKNLTGKTLENDMFHFVVLDENGNAVLSSTNKADGTIEFGSIRFQSEGTFVYTVKEINDKKEGITYDETEYAIQVTVENDEGILTATADFPTEGFVFHNSYKRVDEIVQDPEEIVIKPGTIRLEGVKKLTGKKLEDDKFRFIVSDENRKTVANGTNKADGTIQFEEITLMELGTFIYTITEVEGDEEGITYDTAKYTAIVTVTNDGSDTLKAEIYYPDEKPVFHNSYDNYHNYLNYHKVEEASISIKNNPEVKSDSQIVKTGDDNRAFYWIIVLCITELLIGIQLLLYYKKKKLK